MAAGRDNHIRVTAIRWVDVGLILAIGLAAEAGHFAWRDGRAVISGDSIQYVDAAEALLSADAAPDFAVRKPGYPLLLAGLALLVGNMSWAAIAANHLLLSTLPLAAYGLGCRLHSRVTGWLAALFAVAQLQALVRGGRIMSEAPYMFFVSFGILFLAVAFGRPRQVRWLIATGVFLAAAWLIRSIAIVAIVPALGLTVLLLRRTPRQAVVASLALMLPVAAAVVVECGLNARHGGQFRTSTGSLGLMMMMRARHLQGLPMADSEVGRRCLSLLPDRDPEDAYRASELDTWVARYRAVHDYGMTDWATDALMRRAAMDTAVEAPLEFLAGGVDVFARHLLHRGSVEAFGYVPESRRLPILEHEAAAGDPDSQRRWYAYWALPNRSLDRSLELTARVETHATERAPFAGMEPFSTLRYATLHPAVQTAMRLICIPASLWAPLALAVCGLLGFNRRVCLLVALVYVLEAAAIAICCPSVSAFNRYQCVWLATDAALSASAIVGLAQSAWQAIVGLVGTTDVVVPSAGIKA